MALSNVNSVLVERYAYDVFGRPTIRDPNGVVVEASAFANPYLFTGRVWDGETALYYYRARYYDYYTGRFLQPDPMGYFDNLNPYMYCGNNPVLFIDPSGLTAGSNAAYLWDFASGGGQTSRRYGPTDTETLEMMTSMGAAGLRLKFEGTGYQNVANYEYGTRQAAWDTIFNPATSDLCSTATQVGGFAGATAVAHDNGFQVTYTITNVSGAHSFFYHLLPNRKGTTVPFRSITQTFQWTEIYDWDEATVYVNELIESARKDMADPSVQQLLNWYQDQQQKNCP